MVLLHQLSGLDFTQATEHLSELIQRHNIGICGEEILIKFSAFHTQISLSKIILSVRVQAAIMGVLFRCI